MKLVSLAAIGLVALALIGLLIPVPVALRGPRAVSDLVHAPLFALLSAVILAAVRRRKRAHPGRTALLVWLVVVAVGWLIEGVQHYTGRGPSLQDGFANTVGATAGIVWLLSRAATDRERRWQGVALAAALILAGQVYPLIVVGDLVRQQFQMPELATFETPIELLRWQSQNSNLVRDQEHATEGAWALRVDLHPARFPAAAMHTLPADWSGYHELLIDLHVDEGPPLLLVLKIEDRAHNHELEDRFERVYHLAPGGHTLQIPLDDIAAAPAARTLDIERISFLQFYTIDLPHPRTLWLDHIRLQ